MASQAVYCHHVQKALDRNGIVMVVYCHHVQKALNCDGTRAATPHGYFVIITFPLDHKALDTSSIITMLLASSSQG
jgi:hypothetical protein